MNNSDFFVGTNLKVGGKIIVDGGISHKITLKNAMFYIELRIIVNDFLMILRTWCTIIDTLIYNYICVHTSLAMVNE